MAETTKMAEVRVADLVPYDRNAKQHPPEQVEKLKASIAEFGFLSPLIIDKDNNIIAGHGRVMAAKEMGIDKVPCVYVEGLTDEQRRAYILADNRLTEMGGWDMETVAAELFFLDDADFEVELTGFTMPSRDSEWFENRERFDDSRQEGNDEYNEFLDKFENPKTTDDCFTPDNIYEVIADYVEKTFHKKRRDFVRPFYPGGDYQAEKYKDTDVVVDNPPFSILAEIVDFYVDNDINFFLFAPGLSALNYLSRPSVTAIATYSPIMYENGAKVPTAFLTNLAGGDIAVIADPNLAKAISEENDKNEKAQTREVPKYEYPVEVVTAAKLGYLSKYGQRLEILRKDCEVISALDSQKEQGKGVFGRALLLSEKAAAEKAAATAWPLSDREKAIIKSLG